MAREFALGNRLRFDARAYCARCRHAHANGAGAPLPENLRSSPRNLAVAGARA
jgi:hypothetical protein